MLECCKDSKIKHFLYASSSSVYGLNNKLPYSINDTVDHPVSLYASTKKSNELFAHTYSHLYRLPVTGLRFFTVYGPWGRPDMAPFIFTDAIYKNKKIKIFNNGDMWRDFTYIDDIVEATVLASRIIPEPDASWTVENGLKSASSAPYRIYNLGRGNKTNLLEFIEAIELAAGKKAIKEFKGMQPGDVVSTHADSDELYSAIEFMPKIDVNEGVQKFVDWYKLYYSR
jgi:UDP-glucuronate 4-epimerase